MLLLLTEEHSQSCTWRFFSPYPCWFLIHWAFSPQRQIGIEKNRPLDPSFFGLLVFYECVPKYCPSNKKRAGQETFFSIRLSVWTSAMCILLVRTTKLLAQKIRHDNAGSEKFFLYFKRKKFINFFVQRGRPIRQVGSYFSLSEWESYPSRTFGRPKFPALKREVNLV